MVREIDREELKGMMDSGESFVLINVLDSDAFEDEHICGSINIPMNQIKDADKLISKDETVVVHCTGPACTASATASDILNKIGFQDVRRFKGGIEKWKEARYCLEGNMYKEKAA